MTEPEETETHQQHRAQLTTVILIIVLAIIAGAISWYGIRPGNEMVVTSPSDKKNASNAEVKPVDTVPLVSIAVDEITLPHFEPIMPLGPNREVFMTNCITCHSPRLVIDQPHFSQEKWEEIVNKMVVTFGGHVYKKDQPKIVEYLVSIRGKTE